VKAEFSEGIAYLERWYTWRDQQTDERYGEVYNNGWMHNIVCPDELRTYVKANHGKVEGGLTHIYCGDIYRYDLFQWEDAMRGNGECLYDTAEELCACYGWPGAIHSLEWTDEDDTNWMAGNFYPQTEFALKDGKAWAHLKEKYGYDAYYECENPNDVVLVIEEGDNASQEEVRAGENAPDAKRLVNAAQAMGEDAAYRELAEAIQAFSASAGRIAGRIRPDIRVYFPTE
jgi:hypothetical protein